MVFTKIIDFEKKGNMIRFYLGKLSDMEYWGDDWDDAAYDCNAGTVYKEYVKKIIDIPIKYDDKVLEPCDGYYMSECVYSKDCMKRHKVPCLVVVPSGIAQKNMWNSSFEYWRKQKGVICIYFNDVIEDVLKKIKSEIVLK